MKNNAIRTHVIEQKTMYTIYNINIITVGNAIGNGKYIKSHGNCIPISV